MITNNKYFQLLFKNGYCLRLGRGKIRNSKHIAAKIRTSQSKALEFLVF